MALVSLALGILIFVRIAQRSTDFFYDPRIEKELEAAIKLYRPFVETIKHDMRHRAQLIAADPDLRQAAADGNRAKTAEILRESLDSQTDAPEPGTPNDILIAAQRLAVVTHSTLDQCYAQKSGGDPQTAFGAGRALADVTNVLNSEHEYVRTDCLPLSNDDNGPLLVASFVTSRDRIDHQAQMSETYRLYHEITSRRSDVIWMNVLYFSGIFGIAILISGWFAFNFARSVSRRVATVADAARKAARGDLSIAVPESGADEIWELAVAFNRMLRQINRSRARIEYLQNMGAWQQMARRLAHEIKNPLTPIQLAVEETHSKYAGDDPKFRALLDTTVEIVREEIATLRRLVSEFSEFARMPKASPTRESLQVILRDLKNSVDLARHEKIRVIVDVPPQDQKLAADRQMLRRALDNVVQNAAQAISESDHGGRIEVHTHIAEEGRILIDIDDDGPGISEDKRALVFDPYFTTRREGTGLGLAIVKKIIVEHGGMITCEASPLGGARFRISLPPSESEEARAALAEARHSEKASSRAP